MYDQSIRIKKAANGYELEVKDPEIVAKNRKEDGYTDPNVTYVFKDLKGVTDFLDKNMDKILDTIDDDSFSSTFQKALMEDK